MGLFNAIGKAANSAADAIVKNEYKKDGTMQRAEEECMQKLMKAPVLDELIKRIVEDANGDDPEKNWLFKHIHAFDEDESRWIYITDERVIFKWAQEYYENVQYQESIGDGKYVTKTKRVKKERELGRVDYLYPNLGWYGRMKEYRFGDGKYDVIEELRVHDLWFSLIKERLTAKFPECDFSGTDNIVPDMAVVYKKYSLPDPGYYKWF